MAGELIVTIIGNLTRDPELRFTAQGTPVCNFAVASTARMKQGDDWVDGDPLYFDCAVWRQPAENAAETLRKGMRVILQGRLRARAYEASDGTKKTSNMVDVDEIGPALRCATATVVKAGQATRQAPQQDAGYDPWATSSAPVPAREEPPF